MDTSLLYFGLYFLVTVLHLVSSRVVGWSDSPNSQYHIQTDEGGVRYFKYQTKSGQYRKEKRLLDGTVVGTYGWVDPNGYLRLRDYVADDEGYRIVKTKLIYVGQNSDIESPPPVNLNRSKYFSNNERFQSFQNDALEHDDPSWRSNSYAVPKSSGPKFHSLPSKYSSPASGADVKTDSLSESLFSQFTGSTSSRRIAVFDDTTTTKPLAPFAPSQRAIPIDYLLQPDLELAYDSSKENPTTVQIKMPSVIYDSSTLSPSVSEKFLYRKRGDDFLEKTRLQIQNNERKKSYEKLTLDNNEDFDEVSSVQNGFRYFLPRHYHEETVSQNGKDRAGSFGYVDPFGIRRVIYYNTSPEKGFVHKKNNRYVGFLSTPYDPESDL